MTTFHALQRTQERAGFNIKRSARFVSNALKRGMTADSFASVERDYLNSYGFVNGCRAIAYNDFCFVVSEDNNCITMFALPKWFGKKRVFCGKQKIRDAKKYSLSYISSDQVDDDFVLIT